jgi:hypothetical protein
MLRSSISSNKEHSSSNFISGKVPELSMLVVVVSNDFDVAVLVGHPDLGQL